MYKIKKYFVIFITVINCFLLLFICFKETNISENNIEKVYLYDNVINYISDKDKVELEKIIDGEYEIDELLEESFFNFVGKNVDELYFDNKDVAYAISDADGPVVIQIVADWCDYCVQETQVSLDKIIEEHPETTFIQYMASGSQQQINEFYAKVKKEPNKKLFVAYSNSSISLFFDNYQFSFPTMIFINSEHRITGFAEGLLTSNSFNILYKIANDYPTYNIKTINNELINDALKRKEKAQKYIENLDYIEIPKEELK